MQKLWISFALLGWFLLPASGAVHYEAESKRWTLSNDLVRFSARLTPDDRFEIESLTDARSGRVWRGSSPLEIQLDDRVFDSQTRYILKAQALVENGGTERQTIRLAEVETGLVIEVDFEITEGHPVVRQVIGIENTSPSTVHIRAASLLRLQFQEESGPFRLLRVSQWNYVPVPEQFDVADVALDPGGRAELVRGGSRASHCAWFALRGPLDQGLFAGWEFDGRADAAVASVAADRAFSVNLSINEIYHPVAPGEVHRLPAAFVGVYSGDWDEAGWLTQRFADAVIAQPAPEPGKFPYVSFDTWGYGSEIDEATLIEAANRAARMGAELFVVDLGWSKRIGEWVEDRQKFPSGLRAFSDHVHALGMKFGLHFAFTEAAADAPVLRDNPDWTSSRSYGYGDALSLCLSHEPARQWVIEEAVRMIDEYNVDWVLQDGENMVKRCEKETHTHHPRDGNYSNAVDGLNYVVAEIQRQRPNTRWENCENGGNLMTYNMLRLYATSITNDASGALGARKAVYGASYPFPPRYADRYMPEGFWGTWATRSYFFGGPWQIMNRMTEATEEEETFGRREIQVYKELRDQFNRGKVYHLIAPNDEGGIDALQSHDLSKDRSVVVVTREGGTEDVAQLRVKGLSPDRVYRVHFQDDSRVLVESGLTLMATGIPMYFGSFQASEIVYVEPAVPVAEAPARPGRSGSRPVAPRVRR